MSMQLVINTPGSYLRVKDGNFLVKNEDRMFEVSTKKVQSIMITTMVYLSTDSIKLAMDNILFSLTSLFCGSEATVPIPFFLTFSTSLVYSIRKSDSSQQMS